MYDIYFGIFIFGVYMVVLGKSAEKYSEAERDVYANACPNNAIDTIFLITWFGSLILRNFEVFAIVSLFGLLSDYWGIKVHTKNLKSIGAYGKFKSRLNMRVLCSTLFFPTGVLGVYYFQRVA